MNKRIMHKLTSLIFYAASLLLAIYGIWSFSHCADTIAQARAAGQLMEKGSGYSIANFYMENCGRYAVYALLLAALGLLLSRMHPLYMNKHDEAQTPFDEEEKLEQDRELDEWFTEMGRSDT